MGGDYWGDTGSCGGGRLSLAASSWFLGGGEKTKEVYFVLTLLKQGVWKRDNR